MSGDSTSQNTGAGDTTVGGELPPRCGFLGTSGGSLWVQHAGLDGSLVFSSTAHRMFLVKLLASFPADMQLQMCQWDLMELLLSK